MLGSLLMCLALFTAACTLAWRVRGGLFEFTPSPRPRAFTGGEFKFRPTPSGQLPTSTDLLRTVTGGIPGSGGPLTFGLRRYRIMPSFRNRPEGQRLEVIEFVKSFEPAFRAPREITTVKVPPTPPSILAPVPSLSSTFFHLT
jgi:hypothetical protein